MRPSIPDKLKERLQQTVEETGRPLYKEAGYSTIGSFVEHTVREEIEEAEDKYLEDNDQ